MSAMTLASSLSKDWKDEVFELFEVVIPGGESGLGRTLPISRVRIIVA
jgi:hypothetical protein